MEKWRPIDGFEGRYDISSEGRVYSRVNHILMKAWPAGAGYLELKLGGRARRYVHYLVAYAFLGRPPAPGWEVNHKNGIKTDNRVSNLEWRTHQSNLQHAVAWGLLAAGRRARKLTPEQVHMIRGPRTMPDHELARRLGVTRVVLSQIREGLTYRDV